MVARSGMDLKEADDLCQDRAALRNYVKGFQPTGVWLKSEKYVNMGVYTFKMKAYISIAKHFNQL